MDRKELLTRAIHEELLNLIAELEEREEEDDVQKHVEILREATRLARQLLTAALDDTGGAK